MVTRAPYRHTDVMNPRPLPQSLGPVIEFMRTLWGLDHALSECSKEVRRRYKLTSTERLVLRVMGQTPGVSPGVVASVLHILPSTLTPVLHKLIARGLARRAADPLDRRRAVLWLTPRGERVDAASAQKVDERVRTALALIPASEVFHARRVMTAVAQALGAEKAVVKPRRNKTSRPPRTPLDSLRATASPRKLREAASAGETGAARDRP